MNDLYITDVEIGDKATFYFPEAGYGNQGLDAKKYLTVGETYTVSEIQINSYISYVKFKEITEDVNFNSVLFKFSKKEQ